MSDERLRKELTSLGYTPGPITDSTRSVLEKKLEKLRAEASKHRNLPKGSENGRRVEGVRRRHQEHWADRPVYDDDEDDDDDDDGRDVKEPSTTHTNYLSSNLNRPRYPAEGRLSWGRETVQEEGRKKIERRVDDVLYPRRIVTPAPLCTDSGLWKGGRESLPGERFATRSAGYNRYSGKDLWLGATTERNSSSYSRIGNSEDYTTRYKHSGLDTSSKWPVVNSLSHKSLASPKREKAGLWKPSWAIRFDYYLTKLLQVLCVLLVIVFTGIIAFKSGIFNAQRNSSLKLIPPDCEGRKDSFCKAKEMQVHLEILSELYDFLSIEAGKFDCGNPSGLSSKCVPITRAKQHVIKDRDCSAEKFDAALDWMLNSDRHFGIWAKDKDAEETVTTRANVFCVESSRPRLGVTCRMKNAFYTAVSNLFLALLAILFLWLLLVLLRYHWQRLEEEEKQMFDMIEQIIDVVKLHYKDWVDGVEQNPFVGILHVRDTLIMPQDRKRLKNVWDRAVQFIENNESRLRTESQRVAGADISVWRWTHTQKEYSRERMSLSPVSTMTAHNTSGIGKWQ